MKHNLYIKLKNFDKYDLLFVEWLSIRRKVAWILTEDMVEEIIRNVGAKK